jgi:5-methylthioribose kinase
MAYANLIRAVRSHVPQQKESAMTLIKEEYNSFEELNPTILNGFIGTEIIRRLIGLAQLPLKWI